jgi:hypothetical protein
MTVATRIEPETVARKFQMAIASLSNHPFMGWADEDISYLAPVPTFVLDLEAIKQGQVDGGFASDWLYAIRLPSGLALMKVDESTPGTFNSLVRGPLTSSYFAALEDAELMCTATDVEYALEVLDAPAVMTSVIRLTSDNERWIVPFRRNGRIAAFPRISEDQFGQDISAMYAAMRAPSSSVGSSKPKI